MSPSDLLLLLERGFGSILDDEWLADLHGRVGAHLMKQLLRGK